MAISSIGYAGTVNAAEWAKLAPRIGALYSVDWNGFNASVAAGDRAISVGIGVSCGVGICDTSDSAVTVTHPAAASGVRYDMVVLRRTWSSKLTTVAVVQGTSTRQVPARTTNPGTVDEQPLWLIRITAGSTVPIIEADLRVFRGHGGLAAGNELALQYLTTIGTRVRVGGVVWHCVLGANGTAEWKRVEDPDFPNSSAIELYGHASALDGNVTARGDVGFKIQAGSNVYTSDNAAYTRLTFPKPFPNGLLSVVIMGGDSTVSDPVFYIGGPWGTGNKANVVYQLWGTSWADVNKRVMVPNRQHRINWIAIGW